MMKHAQISKHSRTSIAGLFAFAMMLVLTFAVSCAPPGGRSGGAADASGKTGKYDHLDAEEKIAMSEVVTDEAEEKVALSTLNQAWGGFNEALQLHPGNHRAAFWSEFLKPILEMKGMIARIRPLYLKQELGLERYMRLIKDLEMGSSPEWVKFITDGPNDIDTDERAFELMDRQIVALDSLRIFLKANKDRSFALRAPLKLLQLKQTHKKNDKCAALTIMMSQFRGCPEAGMITFKVNRADLEGLQYIVSAEMLQIAMLFAYKVNPIALFENTQYNRTFKEKAALVMKGYDGGLFARNRLSLANEALADWTVAQRYVVLNQAELCKNGRFSHENRAGYLFTSGFCFGHTNGTIEKGVLEMFETIAAGKPLSVDAAFVSAPVSIYPLKFFNEPPKSIASLMPTSFNPDGEALSVNEAPFSPYFASGTMNDLLQASERERIHDRDLITKRAADEHAASQATERPR